MREPRKPHLATSPRALGQDAGNHERPAGDRPTGTASKRALVDRLVSIGEPISEPALHVLIAQQAERTPDAVAVEDHNGVLTYRELVDRSGSLAARLSGVGPRAVVGICLERDRGLSVALLAVLARGAAYLPLDPDHPIARLEGLLTQAHPALVLTTQDLADRLPAQAHRLIIDEPCAADSAFCWNPTHANDLAYVLHTSGSTGQPKGVMVPHRGIVNRLLWMQRRYTLKPTDRVLQKTPTTFDVSLWELFWPLLVGATVVFAPPGMHLEPPLLGKLMHEVHITHVHFVPSMLDLFLDLTSSFPASVRDIFCSGESLRVGTVHRIATRSRARVHNLYGPTEASVDVSSHEVDPTTVVHPIPIGRPIDNVAAHILDDNLRITPQGVIGEIYLLGAGLARGYIGRPDLTAERFVSDVIGNDGGRMYRTGDRGYVDPDGEMVYIGRVDAQVKVRGVRIEPGEIESTLCLYPDVTGAGVCAVSAAGSTPTLVGHFTAAVTVNVAALREFVAAQLPGPLVPTYLLQIRAFPLTSSGKIDRNALVAFGIPPR